MGTKSVTNNQGHGGAGAHITLPPVAYSFTAEDLAEVVGGLGIRPNGYYEFSIKREGKLRTRRRFNTPNGLKCLARHLNTQVSPFVDVYIGTSTVRQRTRLRWGRAREVDVVSATSLLIDVDPIRARGANVGTLRARADAARVASEISGQINKHGVRPRHVDSGHGQQIILRHEECIYRGLSDEMAALEQMSLKALRARLLDALGEIYGDQAVIDSTSDLSRLCRFPGTINQRTSRVSRVIHPGSGSLSLKSLEELVLRLEAQVPQQTTFGFGEPGPVRSRVRSDSKLEATTAQDVWHERAPVVLETPCDLVGWCCAWVRDGRRYRLRRPLSGVLAQLVVADKLAYAKALSVVQATACNASGRVNAERILTRSIERRRAGLPNEGLPTIEAELGSQAADELRSLLGRSQTSCRFALGDLAAVRAQLDPLDAVTARYLDRLKDCRSGAVRYHDGPRRCGLPGCIGCWGRRVGCEIHRLRIDRWTRRRWELVYYDEDPGGLPSDCERHWYPGGLLAIRRARGRVDWPEGVSRRQVVDTETMLSETRRVRLIEHQLIVEAIRNRDAVALSKIVNYWHGRQRVTRGRRAMRWILRRRWHPSWGDYLPRRRKLQDDATTASRSSLRNKGGATRPPRPRVRSPRASAVALALGRAPP